MAVEGLLGKKVGMTRLFSPEGESIAVTVVEAGPCQVIQRKTPERDGYTAVQLAYEPLKKGRANKPLRGHFTKAGLEPFRYLREFSLGSEDEVDAGAEVSVSIFSPGDRVDVSGISKGRGFTGVVKRHGFSGGPGSHGSMLNRAPGSIGAAAFPSRVFKGKKMPGHMGAERVTVQNLRVVQVIPERNLLLLQGAVPGAKRGLLEIRRSIKKKKSPGA